MSNLNIWKLLRLKLKRKSRLHDRARIEPDLENKACQYLKKVFESHPHPINQKLPQL